jgi:hypothetical protein
MALRPPRIALTIERIVFHGLPLASRAGFRRAFEQECAVALVDAQLTGTAPGDTHIDLTIAADASAEAVGRALARGIVDLMSRS